MDLLNFLLSFLISPIFTKVYKIYLIESVKALILMVHPIIDEKMKTIITLD